MNGTGTVIGLGLLFLAANTAPANAQGGNAPRVADAKPGDVRVMVTAAIRTPLEVVRAEAEKGVCKKLVIEYGSARGNLKHARRGCDAHQSRRVRKICPPRAAEQVVLT